jgi:hypothetical protein
MPKSKRVFISYARPDSPQAGQIATALTERGVDVWMDSQIRPGEDWVEAIEQAIASQDAVVILISANYLRSKWNSYELASSVFANRAGHVRILPVRLDSAPMPILLSSIVYIDATQGIQKVVPMILKAINAGAA